AAVAGGPAPGFPATYTPGVPHASPEPRRLPRRLAAVPAASRHSDRAGGAAANADRDPPKRAVYADQDGNAQDVLVQSPRHRRLDTGQLVPHQADLGGDRGF